MAEKKIGLAVLVSGRGSNLQAIIDAIERKEIPAKIEVVISDNPDAFALQRARKHGIPCQVVEGKSFSSREEYDREVLKVLGNYAVDLIILAGFMRVLSPLFVRAFPNRIMNIHPALLPSFPGLKAQKKALNHGVKISGCTVHFVDEGVDTGPIIIQAAVPVYDDDTEESLSERILKEEHRIYPEAIKLFAEGRLSVEGRRVFTKGYGEHPPTTAMINPSPGNIP